MNDGAPGDADDASTDGPVDRRRVRPRLLATATVLALIVVIGLGRPAIRPYTLDLREPLCLNMFPLGRWSAVGEADPGWSYITHDEIPPDWVGRQVDGTLISWSSGARFSAEGTTLNYYVTGKWGPCVTPAIE